MSEQIADSNYQRLHHFISESPWEHEPVIAQVGRQISALFARSAAPVGLLLDESGHRKSGKESVGVARQYLGSMGKTDNGQVGVFCALSQQDKVGLVGARLYLPKSWTDNKKRCQKACIPVQHQSYKSKPELALEMVAALDAEVDYDWIGGDSLYGNSTSLPKGLHKLGKRFVLDVPENLQVYLQDPKPHIPASAAMGRKKSNFVSVARPLKVNQLLGQLKQQDWAEHTFRTGTKGPMKRKVAVVQVWVWSSKRPTEQHCEQLRLVISAHSNGAEVKYSLSNDGQLDQQCQPLNDKQLLYRQMQRYWVERSFQDCKDVLGMTDYQVRKWRAWQHHITLSMMALHVMLIEKVKHEQHIPLLSCPGH